jgi:hypothetical protein
VPNPLLPDAPAANAIYDFIQGFHCLPGQSRVTLEFPPDEYRFNFSLTDRFGNVVGPELLALTVGTQFVYRKTDLSVSITYEVTAPSQTGYCPQYGVDFGVLPCALISGAGVINDGTQVQVVIGGGGIPPPPSGEPGSFVQIPIESQVQTSWLRFQVEENKQFDAAKIFFRSAVPVPHALSFAVDYQSPPIMDYPDSVRGVGVPWSGEWVPTGDPPAPPATIPDPTTWWTDEGSNPPTPVNAVTGESSVGAITKWGLEAQTTEKWELVNGYGRAVSMLMRMATEEFTEWTLTLWHLKLGSRM